LYESLDVSLNAQVEHQETDDGIFHSALENTGNIDSYLKNMPNEKTHKNVLSESENFLLTTEDIEDDLKIKDYSKESNKKTNDFFKKGVFLRVCYKGKTLVVKKITLLAFFKRFPQGVY